MATTNKDLQSFLALGNASRTSIRSLFSLLGAEVRERHDQHDTTVATLQTESNLRQALAAELHSRIDTVVGLAPSDLDTLKEIADALNSDPQFFATIGAQLSENDLDITEIEIVVGI